MTADRTPITRRRRPEYCASLLTVALAVGGMACSDSLPITGPTPGPIASPTPGPPPSGSLIVRGTVIEFLPVSPDERPAAGVPLRVFGGGTVVEVTSGADGSYEAHVPDTASFVRVAASGTVYYTPCPSFRTSESVRVDGPLDVHVVSGATLSTSGAPNSYPIDWGGRYRYGILGQVRTSEGLEPVSAASVTLHGSGRLENPRASTLTDTKGRYVLCGDRFSQEIVEARKEGYKTASVPAVFGWNYEPTDLLLTRP